MKNMLVIFNVRAEDDVCRLFLPYWQKSGCDILFSSPINAKSEIENVRHIHVGKAITSDRGSWWWYQSRILETMKTLSFMPYDGFILTQYDSICLGKLPDIGRDDCVCMIAGYNVAGFNASFFLHPPWCFGMNKLREFITAAEKYDIKTTEHGIMDRWMSLIIEKEGIQFSNCSWGITANSIDKPNLVSYANQAIKNGCLFVHGVKNESQLNQILA